MQWVQPSRQPTLTSRLCLQLKDEGRFHLLPCRSRGDLPETTLRKALSLQHHYAKRRTSTSRRQLISL